MFIVVGAWISPVALGAVALGVTVGLRAPWWAVLAVVAASAALAVAAAIRIARGAERRGMLATASWPVQQQLRAETVQELPRQERPAIAPQTVNIFNLGADATRAAALIRTAIPGKAGDAITEGK